MLAENKAQLVVILTYHVVPGSVMAAEVVGLNSAPTVNGQNVSITVNDSGVMVDNAMVIDDGVSPRDLSHREVLIGANGATSLLEGLAQVLAPGIVITSDPLY